MGIARRSGEAIGHALRWQIKSPAALLRSAAVSVGGPRHDPAYRPSCLLTQASPEPAIDPG